MTRSRRLVALVAIALASGAAWGEPPKARKYPFPAPPLEVYDRFGKLGLDKADPVPDGDAQLLAASWDARSAKPAKPVPQADDAAVTLHLLAAGVPATDRAGYLKQLTDLVAAAGKATAGAKTDPEKADALLRFLHKGVMAKGYAEDQTTLHGVFDTGKYNCVSSSALYYLVGTRLGLKLQPVLIPGEPYSPGHAAVDLLDGKKRVQIEPTNPDGYDWPAKVNKPGVVVIGPQPDRKKAYDADGFGLAGSAASNLGTAAGKADPPRPAEAVRWQVVALALDPTDPTAADNLVAAVSNWGLRAKDAGRYEDALTLYAFARENLGDKKNVEHNYRVVWEHYLDDAFGAGKFADGLKLVARAAAAFPKDRAFADPAEWVRRAGHRKREKDGWEAGLAYADEAMKHLGEKDAKGVHAWKAETRRHWSGRLVDDGDVGGSLKVLADGLKEAPGNKDLLAGLEYHTQEALAALEKKGGPAAAAAHFKEVGEKFPKDKGAREAGFRHAARAVDRAGDGKKFADALKAADAYKPLAGDRLDEIKAGVFDDWGRALAADEKWDDALAKYAEGVVAFPKNSRLAGNAVATVDEWAKQAMDKKDWKEAIRRYDVGLKHFPDSAHLKHNREYCAKQLEKK